MFFKQGCGALQHFRAILRRYGIPVRCGIGCDCQDSFSCFFISEYHGADLTPAVACHYNKIFPGHMIAMAPPLSEGLVDYGGEPQATVDQMAKDVTAFLAWASEPEMEARKRLGIKVVLFLIIFTGILYAVKRKVWSNIH